MTPEQLAADRAIKPVRIQRRRSKGWRMPENTVCVDRTTKWGNPFIVGGYFMMGDPISNNTPLSMAWCQTTTETGRKDPRYTLIKTNREAVEWYRVYLQRYPSSNNKIMELRGKNLACFCALDQVCHADVLLEIANA